MCRPGLSSLESMKLAHFYALNLTTKSTTFFEGVCKALDGTHALAVAPTPGGKTSYYYGYLVLYHRGIFSNGRLVT